MIGGRSGWQRLLGDGVRVRVAMTWLGVVIPSVWLHSGADGPQSTESRWSGEGGGSSRRFPRRPHAGCIFYMRIDLRNRPYQAFLRYTGVGN
jgi:hypothetical protein